ncbi:MAG TPA: HEAT repeat domain-containing protein [Polyangiaceae bacterium]|nr:HEAT repeat domain-containing protein [Polyangiaceae bacterium]
MSRPVALATRRLAAELSAHLSPLDARLRQRAVRAVAQAVVLDTLHDHDRDEATLAALARIAQRCLGEVERLEAESGALLVGFQRAADERERRELLIRTLTASGRPPAELRKDIAALGRWLDVEAVRERYSTETSDRVDEVLVCHAVIQGKLAGATDPRPLLRAARETALVELALGQAEAGQKPVIRTAALHTLLALVRTVEPERRSQWLGVPALRSIIGWARGQKSARWTQVAALNLCALCSSQAALGSLLAELLASRLPDDGMVIRAAAVRCLSALNEPRRFPLVRRVFADPSEHVRQELARAAGASPAGRSRRTLVRLALRDGAPRVRGVALRELTRRVGRDARSASLARLVLVRCLSAKQPPLVVRVAIACVTECVRYGGPERAEGELCRALERLIGDPATRPDAAEKAAAALRELDVLRRPELARLAVQLREALGQLGEAQSARLELGASERDVVTALRVAARGDHAVGLSPLGQGRYRLTRGEPRRTRLWRLLHEFRSPMPDKRRGYVHSRARVGLGKYVIPPVGMAEVTPTRVHGERLLHGPVGGWGPFLPRVDDLLTASLRDEPVRLVTAFGTIVVRGPTGLWPRLRAFGWLTRRYAEMCALRESALEAQEASGQSAFTTRARSLVFAIELDESDGSLEISGQKLSLGAELPRRYLGLVSAAAAAPTDLLQQLFVHALSPHANEPRQLAVVVWLIFAMFVVRAAAIMQSIGRSRARIPLSIGGWGTRGKSGSERLKAALFHAMRYDVVVKTTGCEAMFIHAQRDLPAQEIFIYRPYDKATIWEQRNMLDVGAQLRAQVFLWECMALQPRFVDTLIDEWMQDPLTTLTNAYPDHEDIQGPGGEDVARVIGRFMPRGGTSFTTEEQMLPLLKDAARNKGSRLVAVDLLEAELLPIDLLDRLPYQEHPRNVALVLRLAEHFSVDREFALVEIADHVILDLGVLKTYPEVGYRGRRMVFSNGMSANERAGFMSNWTRLEFDRHDPDADDATVTVLVVNNRADRVARSRVFAQILVDDAAANTAVIINSNLGGMLTFITEALDRKLPTLLVTGDGPPARILERFDAAMRWLKVPGRPDALERSLQRMLVELGVSAEAASEAARAEALRPLLAAADPEPLRAAVTTLIAERAAEAPEALKRDVLHHIGEQARRILRMRRCRAELEQLIERGDLGSVDALVRVAYRELFLDRIQILWNTGASGDQVIDFITHHIPPGTRARLMGSQNIKGTGLDFVYRWLSLDSVEQRLRKLDAVSQRQETLAWFASYADFGLLDARRARDVLTKIRDAQDPSWAPFAHLLGGVLARLDALVKEKTERLERQTAASPWARVFKYVEAWVDHLDSARRSAFAGRVLVDLFAARIGHGRAALLLREVTARQKGGWLFKDFKKFVAKLPARRGATQREPSA